MSEPLRKARRLCQGFVIEDAAAVNLYYAPPTSNIEPNIFTRLVKDEKVPEFVEEGLTHPFSYVNGAKTEIESRNAFAV